MKIFVIAMTIFLNGQYQNAAVAHNLFGNIYLFTNSENCEAKLNEIFITGMVWDRQRKMKYEISLSKFKRRILTVIGSPRGGSAIEEYRLNCYEITVPN